MTTKEDVKAEDDKKTPPPASVQDVDAAGKDAAGTTDEAQAGKGEVEGAGPGKDAAGEAKGAETPLPTLDFSTLILSLSSSALMNRVYNVL